MRWHRAQLVRGYGVASGLALDSPYPAGTIALQAPYFAAHGLDLGAYYPGTLNFSFSDTRWQLSEPDWQVEHLCWTDRHPPETFSFWRVALRWQGVPAPLEALLYWPHPETKQAHQHSPDRLEVLAPWIANVASLSELELGVDPRRCRRVQPLRLQARLLEALKFRVLASQQQFFAGLETMAALRHWLAAIQPEALDLSDQELLLVLERARALYCDERGLIPIGINGDNASGPLGLP